MTPSGPFRNPQIIEKENAIKRRLEATNRANMLKAMAPKSIGKGKKPTVTASYKAQEILGKDKGFTPSDYGANKGAAIPYQIGTVTKTVSSRSAHQATKPSSPNRSAHKVTSPTMRKITPPDRSMPMPNIGGNHLSMKGATMTDAIQKRLNSLS